MDESNKAKPNQNRSMRAEVALIAVGLFLLACAASLVVFGVKKDFEYVGLVASFPPECTDQSVWDGLTPECAAAERAWGLREFSAQQASQTSLTVAGLSAVAGALTLITGVVIRDRARRRESQRPAA